MTVSLNELMQLGTVVYSDGEGTVSPQPGISVAEELVAVVDQDGNFVLDDATGDFAYEGLPQGWGLLRGYTGQDRYTGAFMHPSEFVGGGLERDILAEAGFYVCLPIRAGHDGEWEGDWAVAHKPSA